jgi:Lipoprotein LpqB beta-propeller domain/Sporulation and spore germination
VCLLGAVVASVAGCVGMPDSGGVGQVNATQSAAAQNENDVGVFARDPQPGWTPAEVVTGFLGASASPADSAIAQEYLADPGRTWDPGWSVTVFSQFSELGQTIGRTRGTHGPEQAEVDLGGTVQATFDGTGQYVAAQSRLPSSASYPFRLTQVGGQWRIVNPPPYRMVTEADFPQVYKPLDLYFFGSESGELVPDPVFVPDSTLPALLVANLVRALIDGPQTSWLRAATSTEFPAGTSVLGVSLDGATVVVNLGKAAVGADPSRLTQISAQLAWTLAGVTLGGPGAGPAIQSVELEVDGKPFTPSPTPCGGSPSPSPVQKQAAYDCYNPYLSTPAGFYFVDDGQPWSRCGLVSEAQIGQIGQITAVFGRQAGSAAPSAGQCGSADYVSHDSTALPPAQPAVKGAPLTMVAMSPDGRYLAGVSASDDTVYIYALASGTTTSRWLGPDITAISWDRNDDLWIAQQGTVRMMPASGAAGEVEFAGADTGEYVSSLSVAPDGVRIGLIVGQGTSRQLELATITSPTQSGAEHGTSTTVSQISPAIRLAPSLADPDALTWYDADQLVVLSQVGGSSLWQVPVDGEQPSRLAATPADIVSVTADGDGAALVAGLAGGHLDVSAGLEGPWQPLGVGGYSPAYPG